MKFGVIEKCQVCESDDLRSAVFLGYLPPVNSMRPIGVKPDKEYWFPAEMLYCAVCHLVQLGFSVDPNILFPPEYPYTSGSTRILRENFADLHREARERVGLSADDLVVDIGSNDGTLLSNFKDGGCRVVGIEPTLTGELARARDIPTLMSFFNRESAAQVKQQYGAPKIVTAANVFAHINDVHQIVDSIEQLVGTDGVFISESHYLYGLIETLQYDTIYHEHLRYYSLTSLKYLLNAHGLQIFHAKRIPTHGGSIRVYASKSEAYPVDDSVARILREEAAQGLTSDTWISEFRGRVTKSKLELYELISSLKRERMPIYGIGAPSRASTLVTYVGLDDGILDCVMEIKGSKKVGKYLPGTNIPVLDEEKLYVDQPPYVLLLSWHIADELCRNLKRHGYRGDFIVPLPTPHIIRNDEIVL
ncbi:MAG: class I SAM-dependent methyltransferase [Acidobacteria bacterium]|nr:class I SAM-dependent methyltransferase [Acidobacteriota bacterium]